MTIVYLKAVIVLWAVNASSLIYSTKNSIIERGIIMFYNWLKQKKKYNSLPEIAKKEPVLRVSFDAHFLPYVAEVIITKRPLIIIAVDDYIAINEEAAIILSARQHILQILKERLKDVVLRHREKVRFIPLEEFHKQLKEDNLWTENIEKLHEPMYYIYLRAEIGLKEDASNILFNLSKYFYTSIYGSTD